MLNLICFFGLATNTTFPDQPWKDYVLLGAVKPTPKDPEGTYCQSHGLFGIVMCLKKLSNVHRNTNNNSTENTNAPGPERPGSNVAPNSSVDFARTLISKSCASAYGGRPTCEILVGHRIAKASQQLRSSDPTSTVVQ